MTKEQTIEAMKILAEKAGIEFDIKEKQDKKYEFKYRDKYYYISCTGETQQAEWSDKDIDNLCFNFGNVYTTQEEAKKASLNIQIWNKLRMFAEEANEGWKPNWFNGEEKKYYVAVDHISHVSTIAAWKIYMRNYIAAPFEVYFKSEELAKRAINEIIVPFGEEHGDII